MTQDVLDGPNPENARPSARRLPRPRFKPNLRAMFGRGKALAGALAVVSVIWWLSRAFFRVGLHHEARSAFLATATWGTLVLASFAGWGTAVNLAVAPRRPADWGLRCAWGWGAVVALGGGLCVAGLARGSVLVFVVALGLLFLAVGLVRSYLRWSRRSVGRMLQTTRADWPFVLGVAGCLSLGVTQALASIQTTGINGDDDNICYFAFAKEILDRGTLTQPFSLRRASAYGAKSLLDALQLAVPVPIAHVRVVDGGLALLTVMVLVVGHVRASRWTSRSLVLLLLLLIATMPEIRINTATTMVGVVFFLGLYRSAAWYAGLDARGWRRCLPIALMAAGTCALRQNYLVPVAVFLVAAVGMPIVRGYRRGSPLWRSPALVDAAVTFGLLVAFLAPWWILAWRWSGTFLFPVVKGNFDPQYPMFWPSTRFEQLRYLWASVSYCLPLKAVPLFLVAALAMAGSRSQRTLSYFLFAAFVGFAALVWRVPDSDAPNLARYYFGFTFAAIVATILAVAESSAFGVKAVRLRASRAAALPLVIVGLALQLYGDREETARRYEGYLASLQPQFEDPPAWVPPEGDKSYQALQDAVPAGASIAAMVDDPSNFDFKRNQIELLDIVGAVSPKPGIPLFGGPERFADYLVSLGYDYAILVRPEGGSSLYRRDKWRHNQQEGLPIWKRTAAYYLAAFDIVDGLAASHVRYMDVGGMSTIDLRR